MSAISKALAHVKFVIPNEILKVVFIDRLYHFNLSPISIDHSITSEVIKPRVLVDCNLMGGQEALVSLQGLFYDMANEYTTIIHIPKERTDGRSINSVLNITLASQSRLSALGSLSMCGSSPALLMGQAILDAIGPAPITSTAYVRLIAENTIMVQDSMMIPTNAYLRCVLSMDDELSHLQLRSYPVFSKMVEYAVKSYIYNQYIIQMDIAELQGGHSIGRFKEVIDSYADAEENYQDYLINTVQKVLLMNDESSNNRIWKLMIGTQR